MNNETTQKKFNQSIKNYFDKFIEELDFVELHTQAKHPRVWILHDEQMLGHDIIVSFSIFSLLKYDSIFSKKLEHDTYGVRLSPSAKFCGRSVPGLAPEIYVNFLFS